MTYELNVDDVERISALPAVREAATAGARLVALWPLTAAMHMDNDAKYAENLQVRVTRAFARILTGEDVTVPDAEFVYEGADAIPGRPQLIVDALLAANDAYDAMADFSETGDASLIDDAVEALGVEWPDEVSVRVHEVLESLEAAMDAGEFDSGVYAVGSQEGDGSGETSGSEAGKSSDAAPTDDDFQPSDALVDAVAHRFAAGLAVFDALIGAVVGDVTVGGEESVAEDGAGAGVGAGADDAVKAFLPLVLVINELNEQLAVPRIALNDEQIRELLETRAKVIVGDGDEAPVGVRTSVDAVAGLVSPLAAGEWDKHREDVLWDPAAAKKKAKEEDEKRNKEALAAKFAHIKAEP
ncbi:hypothetical protein [Bifidobacterium callitrichos]|uniref:Uncharacterized protein n=1 Tax=Bifidobacterium callitrichos DSM 23973 TaxID=1437609 RepID=A0A087A6T9_9BIFI|nr:hypothetical protein [Bifidobacterium callitrichos]KFI54489.1 hypothetical protein BCAL_1425 [Bifidobacterium callitrichos DSM 23973]